MNGLQRAERRKADFAEAVAAVLAVTDPLPEAADFDRNVCGLDRATRFVAGAVLVFLALLGRRGRGEPGREGSVARWQLLATAAGAELLVTGLLQWCPANAALGIDSCEHDWVTAVRLALGR